MAFRVSTSPGAERDPQAIFEWLVSEGAGDAGSRWLDGLEDAIASLESTPRRCSVAPESETYDAEVRQLLYGNKPHVYRILFTVEGDDVTVLRIRHGRRLPLVQQ